MKRLSLLLASFSFAACARAPLPVCDPSPGPAVDSATVCGHLAALGCRFDDPVDGGASGACANAYGQAESTTDATEFARLTRCYAEATSCDQVALCSLACVGGGSDAGADAGVDAEVDAGP